jgi:uncharacterized protein (TIGR03083 family)
MTTDDRASAVPREELDALVRTERLATLELLESLDPQEWQTPSLCAGWTVRAVAAHLAWAPVTPPWAALPELVRAGFRVNVFVRDSAVRWSARPLEEILDRLRENAATGARPFGVPDPGPLSDAVVHGLDMRRPLGRPRPVPAAAFVPLADWHARLRGPGAALVGGSVRRRIAPVRLVADGVEWAHGTGPEVRGTPEALLLLLTNRPVAPGELTGPGVALLR